MLQEYEYNGDRDLDLKIATKLFGWRPKDNPEYFWFTSAGINFNDLAEKIWGMVGGYSGPEFSNDFIAAFMAVDEITNRRSIGGLPLEVDIRRWGNYPYEVCIDELVTDSQYGGTNVIQRYETHAKSLPMAISLAVEKYIDGDDKY